MIQKTFHIDLYGAGWHSVYHEKGTFKKNQDSVNTSLRLLLNKINMAGLLTNRVYANALHDIDSSTFQIAVQMISQLVSVSYRLDQLEPNKLLPVAKQLHHAGIVSDTAFLRLQNDINNGNLESSFQLNNYCNFDRIFNLEKYPDDPSLWLEQLHREIASILPGLSFTGFNYTTSIDSAASTPNLRNIKYKVSLVCNGRKYKYVTNALVFKTQNGKMHFSDFAAGFYRIFNKVLTDNQSLYRLHLIRPDYGTSSENPLKRFSLIALTKSESEALMEKPAMPYMLESLDNYDTTLTSLRIDSTLLEWKKIGLLAHLTEAQYNKAIDDAESDDLFSMDHLLFNFPIVLYSLDSALKIQNHTYINLLSHLAGITHGAFRPERITQRKVKDGVYLQYLYKGKTNSYIFNTEYGWFDKRFTKFVKGLGPQNNLTGNFYFLPYENAIIYLTQQQHTYVVEHKLLNLTSPHMANRKNK